MAGGVFFLKNDSLCPEICSTWIGRCQNGEAEQIQQKVQRGVESEEDLQEVISFVERYEGIEQAREEARSYARSAIQNLDGLSDSEARNALEMAVHYVAERQR